MRFEKYIEQYSDHLRIKDYSKRTQRSYSFESKRFIDFIEEHYPRIDKLTQITKDIVIDYSNYLSVYKDKRGKPLSSKTQRLKLIVIRSFFQFLAKNDFILKDPTTILELPKEELTLPKNILTEKEAMMILNSCGTRTPLELRNRAVLETFYSTGMRTSELASLKIHDLDLKEQVAVIVLGKGKKTRYVPLGQYACFYIEEYLSKARKFMLKGRVKDEGYVFLTSRGTQFNRETLNKCVMRQVTKGLKLKKHVTCYSWRHAAATHLIKNKVDIRYVGELLGHASLKTTTKYCHIDITDLKKMHSLYHPRDNKNTPNDLL